MPRRVAAWRPIGRTHAVIYNGLVGRAAVLLGDERRPGAYTKDNDPNRG